MPLKAFAQHILLDTTRRLSVYPKAFVHWLDRPKLAGWHMHAVEVSPDLTRSPGVYSTAFAVQLLCSSDRPEEASTRPMILAGMRFLVEQWRDSEAVLEGGRPRCKQYEKKQEVGHTDFELTLKCVAVLDAGNALAEIRDRHADFGAMLDESDSALGGIAKKLKAQMRSWEEEGKSRIGWPWHFMSDERDWDAIPTAKAVLALTHPSSRPTPRYLDAWQAGANTLSACLSLDDTVVHKAIACRALLTMQQRSALGRQELPSEFAEELSDATSRVADLPWQEVLHYSVPFRSHKVSHYKPWIWICPRMEIAETAILVDPHSGVRSATSTVTDLLGNIRHYGAVRFLSAQPPTLLATRDAQRFLSTFQSALDGSTRRQAQFLLAWYGFRMIMSRP